MRHIDLGGEGILLARVHGQFYAVDDRCGHEGARLSAGRLDGTIITCPAHFSRFNLETGKAISGPAMGALAGLTGLSPRVQALARKKAAEMAQAPVADLRVYLVKVEDGRVLVEV
ncbi:Naphthalene 1,2-dioxygenase/salicylate 5-hydroxylase system, ferredoxin component [anaerobic digester metagenome]